MKWQKSLCRHRVSSAQEDTARRVTLALFKREAHWVRESGAIIWFKASAVIRIWNGSTLYFIGTDKNISLADPVQAARFFFGAVSLRNTALE